MLRPEQLSNMLSHFPRAKVMHIQILTSLWAALDHSLGESETNKITIARIEAESAVVRKIAGLPEPRPEPEAKSRDQGVGLICSYLQPPECLTHV